MDDITDLVRRKRIDYDHKAKSKDYKYSNEFELKTVSMDYMPPFLKQNFKRYSEWFDFKK